MPMTKIEALAMVYDLANENALDPNDAGEELYAEACAQQQALKTVDAWLQELKGPIPVDTRLKWSEADSKAANLQGWDIFDTERNGPDRWQLQRNDSMQTFASDPEMIVFVWRWAVASSQLHRRALEFIRTHSDGEWDMICTIAHKAGLQTYEGWLRQKP